MPHETILITRPLSEDTRFQDELHERGFRTIHEPLTEIFLLHTARAQIEAAMRTDPHGVIVTSQHGVKALAALNELRDIALICVGSATEEAAQNLGFTRTVDAGGDVDRLIQFIADAYDTESRFLYISANHTRTDLVTTLMTYGMEAERIIAYEAEPVRQLSDTLVEQLRRGQLDAVTFLSQRSASIFLELVNSADINPATDCLHAFALSDVIAETLSEVNWQGVHIAPQATLASLIECIDNAFNRESSDV
ncbi:MAG: uroporphyrinogen-III synthase [Rickettsiales bacterium]|nr:uroporphyrinogen-III synthase [Rickettsiales bacterium]